MLGTSLQDRLGFHILRVKSPYYLKVLISITGFRFPQRRKSFFRHISTFNQDFCRSFYRSSNFPFHTLSKLNAMSSDAVKPPKIMRFEERLVWIDLEMTGLNVDKEAIMEAAVIITDSNLNVLKEGPNLTIKVDDEILDSMCEWCKKHHGKSGLTQACRKSNITLTMAEDELLQFVVQHTEPGKAPLAGNSVHSDKKFLDKYMQKLMKHLHYRIIDVSSVKELCRRWYPIEFNSAPKKKLTHRVLDDIKESIQELKYYKESIFK